jgi:hypothetical protein
MRIAFKSFRSARLDASASSLSAFSARLLAIGIALPLAMVGLGAAADEPDDAIRATGTPDSVIAAAAPEASSLLVTLDGDSALSTAELTEQRAKAKIEIERITVNETDQDGTVAGNVAVGDTGANTIADHAFEGAAGTIMSIQNTGNNVLIQNSTTINVSVE